MENKPIPKKYYVFLVLAIVFVLGGIATFGITAWLMVSTEKFQYFFICFAGMALFMAGGVFLALMGRLRVKNFWQNHQTEITISSNSKNPSQKGAKICNRCHEVNDNDAIYCKKCGEKLQ